MNQPVFHQGNWWYQNPDGSWSRWDPESQQWMPFGPAVAYRAPAAKYTPLRNIARWTVIAIAADMVASVITALVSARQLDDVKPTDYIPIEEYMEVVAGPQLAIQLSGWVSIASGVLFVIWFYRAYQNLLPLRTQGRFTSGWAIGAWLVPVLNLWRPKQIADDIWRTSDPALPSEPGTTWLNGKVHPLLHWWWAIWLLATAGAFIGLPVFLINEFQNSDFFVAGSSDPSFTPMIRSISLLMVTTSIGRVLAGAIAIPVVRRMTERQERRAVQLDTAIEA